MEMNAKRNSVYNNYILHKGEKRILCLKKNITLFLRLVTF